MSKEEVKGHFLPEEILDENAKAISEHTFSYKSFLWMRNMAQNMQRILEGHNLAELMEEYRGKRGSAIVVGGGPSIERHRHLDILAESGYEGTILACDKMLIPLLKRGVIPDIVGTVDGDPRIAKYYDDPIVNKYASEIKAVFCANSVSPEVVERWIKAGGEIWWFIAIWDDPVKNVKSVTRLLHFMTGKMMCNVGGNIGTTLWNIAYMLGRNPIALIGMDLGYPEDTDLTKTPYYDAWVKMTGGDPEAIARCFRKGYNPHFKCYYYTDLMFDAYRRILEEMIKHASVKTINCTEGGSLHFKHPNFKCMKLKTFLKKFKR